MRRFFTATGMSFLALLFAATSNTSEIQTYKHPTLNFQYKASKNWKPWPRTEDPLIFEMTASDTSIHVMLWYTETEQDAGKYLLKMSDMKDLDLENAELEQENIGNLDAWVLRAPGMERTEPVYTILAVVAHGMSNERPKEHALYIVQIWCERENYKAHAKMMEKILASIEIAD